MPGPSSSRVFSMPQSSHLQRTVCRILKRRSSRFDLRRCQCSTRSKVNQAYAQRGRKGWITINESEENLPSGFAGSELVEKISQKLMGIAPDVRGRKIFECRVDRTTGIECMVQSIDSTMSTRLRPGEVVSITVVPVFLHERLKSTHGTCVYRFSTEGM